VNQPTTQRANRHQPVGARRDAGHTGVEMVAVLALVGFLGSMVALMVTGMRTEAATAVCSAEGDALTTAAVHYLVATGDDGIPASGTGADRYELTLVDAGFLRSASASHDLDARGAVVNSEESSC
jgi:type II secretory pathway pseudopilin PulG